MSSEKYRDIEMKHIKSLLFPIAIIAVLLPGCDGLAITLDEAITAASLIEEHFDAEDYQLPSKYEMTLRMDTTSQSHVASQIIGETYDREEKYLYWSLSYSTDDIAMFSESWMYYEASEGITYLVMEQEGEKYHDTVSGDYFTSTIENTNLHLHSFCTSLSLSQALAEIRDGTYDNDSRNVYRSSGEGSLYCKLYVTIDGAANTTEIRISDYQLVEMSIHDGEGRTLVIAVEYLDVSTDKPNLSDYPPAS